MTILSDIRYLIGIHIAQKGFPPSVVAPVLNILRLVDEELRAVGYDFENPEVEKEAERLSQAIVKLTHDTEEVTIYPFEAASNISIPKTFLDQLDPFTKPTLEEEEDHLAWMDKLGDEDDD